MHILGLAVGSHDGNSEILLKMALITACEAADKNTADTDSKTTASWVHIPSVSIPPNPKPLDTAIDVSMGTVSSMQSGGNTGALQIPDDRPALLSAVLDADAIIISTPVYSHQPPGCLKAVFDRILGPYTDAALARMVVDGKMSGGEKERDMAWPDERTLVRQPGRNGKIKGDNKDVGERGNGEEGSYNAAGRTRRVVGFMAVAGSQLDDQVTQVLPSLHTLLYGLHVRVVDQVVFRGFGNPGAVLVANSRYDEGEVSKRAAELGFRVGKRMTMAEDDDDNNDDDDDDDDDDDTGYEGEKEEGACPYCGLTKVDWLGGEGNRIGCLGCGCKGRVEVKGDGKGVKLVWDEGRESKEASCVTMAGKVKHVKDIMEAGKEEKERMKEMGEELERRRDKWRSVKFPVVDLPSNRYGI